jgi:hypothetical protein
MTGNDFMEVQALLMFVAGTARGLTTIASDDVQWENREYTPSKGTQWMRVSTIHTDSFVATLGGGGEDQHEGILLLELFYPPDDGFGAATTDADIIRAAAKAGVQGISGATALYIKNTRRSGGRVDDGWYRIDLEVEWYARSVRP